ncbi:MAG: 5-oxoprolinase/urea amidolyase family protein [Tissierellia bacterium]|nr:5-oxoprolinase/urea amidolyase family protein [Tissierellia bacterium]
MEGKLHVIKPGLLSTIQDQGRWGYQQYGVAVAGAMDPVAMELANRLVGNEPGAPLIEMTLLGGTFRLDGEGVAAFTGAHMGAKLDGQALPPYQAFVWKRGQVLEFSGAQKGVRTYLALGGQWKLDPVLGSYSTYLRGKMGGLRGQALEAGDQIPLDLKEGEGPLYGLDPQVLEEDLDPGLIRVVMGPQEEAFTEEGKKTFLSATYEVSKDIDRMGYRLAGPAIETKAGSDIISDGIVFGSIQVSGDGQPTLMMADHQTTGGYAKIATIIRPDLSKLAQMNQGHRVHFKAISPQEALEIYRAWRRDLDQIEDKFIETERQAAMTWLDIGSIEKLLDHFEASNIESLSLDMGDFHIELDRQTSQGPGSRAKRPQERPQALAKEEEGAEDPGTYPVLAPITGTCYRSPDPEEPPFVEVGQEVKEGDTLMIIEVMKMMNEVKAPRSGRVKEILVENEEAVQAEAVLLVLEVDDE